MALITFNFMLPAFSEMRTIQDFGIYLQTVMKLGDFEGVNLLVRPY